MSAFHARGGGTAAQSYKTAGRRTMRAMTYVRFSSRYFRFRAPTIDSYSLRQRARARRWPYRHDDGSLFIVPPPLVPSGTFMRRTWSLGAPRYAGGRGMTRRTETASRRLRRHEASYYDDY